jgi:glucose-6-phosphate 1-epimerase
MGGGAHARDPCCNTQKIAGREVILEDRGLSRKVVIKPVHFSDAVVWNPWAENAKKMADLGDEEYQEMLCIEPANASLFVRGECIEVAPGGTWSASQEIHVEKL